MSTNSGIPATVAARRSSATVWLIAGAAAVFICLCCLVLAALGLWLYRSGQIDPDFWGRGLDPNATPRSGTTDLHAGFIPDPFSITLTGGGSVDVAAQELGANCTGYTSREPNLTLNWSGQSGRMGIFFVSSSGQDPTLLVRSPQGSWHCNDDFTGGVLDPMVEIASPAAGEYDIWVGSWTKDEIVSGTLSVTEGYFDPTQPYGYLPPVEQPTGDALDLGAPPVFGEINLASGFDNDPFSIEVTSGGSVDVMAQNLGPDFCNGYTNRAPSFRIHWTGRSDRLSIFFTAGAGEDTTLVVNDPSGQWRCNDDWAGLDPGVTFYDPLQGQYDIWVGSYNQGMFATGTLYITQQDDIPARLDDPGNRPFATPDYSLPPSYGTIDLAAGFSPDPHALNMIVGGEMDLFSMELGDGCFGYTSAAPDLSIYWAGPAGRLRFYFVADDGADTTLVVNNASAEWVCNDDSPYGLDPLLDIDNPPDGRYDIWVGSFNIGRTTSGTLYITTDDSHP